MEPDWTKRGEILRRLILLAHVPGSGFCGVWCDNCIIRLKREPWHDPDKFEYISWDDAADLAGVEHKPVQSVIITGVERREA